MTITKQQIKLLTELMIVSAQKGNLANSAIVLDDSKMLASAESWSASSTDATAHSERMLVEIVCKLKHSNHTPGLTMITVLEPCLMCLSACAWAGYSTVSYIIPATKYIKKIPWMAETTAIDKAKLSKTFDTPINYIRLKKYENQFSKTFEKEMKRFLV